MLYYDCSTTSIVMYCRTPFWCATNKIVVFHHFCALLQLCVDILYFYLIEANCSLQKLLAGRFNRPRGRPLGLVRLSLQCPIVQTVVMVEIQADDQSSPH